MVTFVKPGPATGSVEHFYHFTVEYLLPLFERDLLTGITGKGLVIRDCGPMNAWLDFVFGPGAFIRIPRDDFAAVQPRRLFDKQIQLESFADQSGIRIDAGRFNDVLTAFRDKFMTPVDGELSVTVLDRGNPPAFYLDGRAEIPGGGNTRRSISNLDALARKISDHTAVNLVRFDDSPPSEQLAIINQTSVLVGQHGAGLVHSIFTRDDATLVEFRTMHPSHTWFKNLNEGLGRNYREIEVSDRHVTLSDQTLDHVTELVVDLL
jgi:hypothetical protein